MKYCKVGNQAENKGETKEHKCFMNWEDSSRSMESDMILEAFHEAEDKYNLHYMLLVGDGDLSVLATLQANGPPWCRRIKKIECLNYCCKCCRGRGALEKLVDDHPEFKGWDKLTKRQRVRIVSCMHVLYLFMLQQFLILVKLQQPRTYEKKSLASLIMYHDRCKRAIQDNLVSNACKS